MELIVLLRAELDIQAAFNRFEQYRNGFGLKFLQELELAYEYLTRHPDIGRLYADKRPVSFASGRSGAAAGRGQPERETGRRRHHDTPN